MYFTQEISVLQVYQCLDNELQRLVSLQDTLLQCQTWLSSIAEAKEPPAHPALSLEATLCKVGESLLYHHRRPADSEKSVAVEKR